LTLTVVTYLWGARYSVDYVNRLGEGLRRHMDVPYRFVCLTDYARTFGGTVDYQDRIRDLELTKIRGCFTRLRLFDPQYQRSIGIAPGDRVLVLDLDLVIVGKLSPLVLRPEPFIILQGVNNPRHPCPYTGSVWATMGGLRPDVWWDFSLEAAAMLPKYEFSDDQGWMHHKMPNAGAYTDRDGVYAFGKGPWPKGHDLPPNARIVAFPGSKDPKLFTHLPWLKNAWLGMV